jgi:2-keto-4-pentenoate hydratase/2-oxohepta-3-ene-1,7-dioic acid hydratase in catechol pathway
VDLGHAAKRARVRGLEDIADVGDLLRRGDATVDLARRLATSLGASDGVPIESVRLAPPVIHPRVFVCVGRNYLEHIREGKADVPTSPILFAKFANSLVGDGAKVVYHKITRELDYEGELAVVIGRRAAGVAAAEAMNVVAGYSIVNDISARDLQNGDVQWIRGKSLDTFAPMGPVFVTADEVPDVDALRIETRVNGELRQSALCGEMIFKVPRLIEFITEGITLQPGDLIATGTPSGVGAGMTPPRWLQIGDTTEVSISGLGELRSVIAAPVGYPLLKVLRGTSGH